MTSGQQVLDIELPLKSFWQIPNMGIYFENAYPRNFLAWAMSLNSSLGDELLTEGKPWRVSHYDLTALQPDSQMPSSLLKTSSWRVPDVPTMSSWKIFFWKCLPKKTFWRGPCLWIHRLAIVWKTNEASTLPKSIYHLWRAARCQESKDTMGWNRFWISIILIIFLNSCPNFGYV